MVMDPSIMHREEISRLETLKSQVEPNSEEWKRHDDWIDFHNREIERIARKLRGGMKF